MNTNKHLTTAAYLAAGIFAALAVQTAVASQAWASPQDHQGASGGGQPRPVGTPSSVSYAGKVCTVSNVTGQMSCK